MEVQPTQVTMERRSRWCMARPAKSCLRKAIGNSWPSFDKLLTLVMKLKVCWGPLTYVSFKESLTLSYLIISSHMMTLPDPSALMSFSDNLTRKMGWSARELQSFWKGWKNPGAQELSLCKTMSLMCAHAIKERGYDKSHPRGLWRLGKVEDLIQGADGVVHGVYKYEASPERIDV